MSLEKSLTRTDRIIKSLITSHEDDIVREYARALVAIRRELAAVFDRYGDLDYKELTKYGRLATLEKKIFKEINKLTGTTALKLKNALGNVYRETFYRTAYSLEVELQQKLAFGLLNPNTIERAINNPLDKYGAGQKKDTLGFLIRNSRNQELLKSQIRSDLTQGLIRGEGYAKISKRLKDRLEIGASRAVRIAQTEAHRVQTEGRLDSLAHAQAKGVDLGYRWVATLDDRTRDLHQEMDGQEAEEIVDGRPLFVLPDGVKTEGPGLSGIAEHDINCRCTVTAFVRGHESEKRRARGGGVIPYKSYKVWMKARVEKVA